MLVRRSVAVLVSSVSRGLMIRDAVDSVLRQFLAADELIIVGDGSTDECSLDALADLERGGIDVLPQGNSGFGAARSSGIHSVTADLVAGSTATPISVLVSSTRPSQRSMTKTSWRRRRGWRCSERLTELSAQRVGLSWVFSPATLAPPRQYFAGISGTRLEGMPKI